MESRSKAKMEEEEEEQQQQGGGDATYRAYLEVVREALDQYGKAADHLRALEAQRLALAAEDPKAPPLDRMIMQAAADKGKAEVRLNNHERGRKHGSGGEDGNPAAAKRSRVELQQAGPLQAMWRTLKDGKAVLKNGRVMAPCIGPEEDRDEAEVEEVEEEEVEEKEGREWLPFGYKYLELPEGIQFCTTRNQSGRRLLVRKCYPRTFDQWWDRVKEKGSATVASCEILIGSLGIGKSMFLLYALYRLAQAGEHKVVFQATDGEMTLFDGDTVTKDQTAAKQALQDVQSVYLVDGAKQGDRRSCKCPYFLISSPNRDVYSRDEMDLNGRHPYCMPVFSPGEMFALRELCAPTISEKQAIELYYTVGGVPRLLLKLLDDPTDDMTEEYSNQAKMTTFKDCEMAAKYGQAKEGGEMHGIFHFVPGAEDPRKYTVRFCSTFVARAFSAQQAKHILR